jgi:hypothetical protein
MNTKTKQYTVKQINAIKERWMSILQTILKQKKVTELSDEVLEKSFSDYVGSGAMIKYAKEFRDEGIFKLYKKYNYFPKDLPANIYF